VRIPHIAAITLLLLCPACAGYDFAKARRPDGGYDLEKLKADLAASGEDSLTDGIWIPLICLDFTSFERSEPSFPAGYSLTEATFFGPIALGGSYDVTLFDEKLAPVEVDDRDWFGWGLLFYDRELDVHTKWGRRHGDVRRYLLLFGPQDEVFYYRDEPQP
jgi:hypothetical protein